MRSIRKIHKEFKDFDGGVLKFEDAVTKRKRYFEMNYLEAKPILRLLKTKKEFFLLMFFDDQYKIFSNQDDLVQFLDIEKGSLIRNVIINEKKVAIADRNYVYYLLDNMMCPEKEGTDTEITIGYTQPFETYDKPIKKASILPKKDKQIKEPAFDWHEEFLEGMRIFGNVDEAEAYADEMKRKKTGKI